MHRFKDYCCLAMNETKITCLTNIAVSFMSIVSSYHIMSLKYKQSRKISFPQNHFALPISSFDGNLFLIISDIKSLEVLDSRRTLPCGDL